MSCVRLLWVHRLAVMVSFRRMAVINTEETRHKKNYHRAYIYCLISIFLFCFRKPWGGQSLRKLNGQIKQRHPPLNEAFHALRSWVATTKIPLTFWTLGARVQWFIGECQCLLKMSWYLYTVYAVAFASVVKWTTTHGDNFVPWSGFLWFFFKTSLQSRPVYLLNAWLGSLGIT